MKRRPTTQTPADAFDMVRTVGLALPDVEATTKYDGSPVLKLGGSFMAGLAIRLVNQEDLNLFFSRTAQRSRRPRVFPND